MATRRSVLTGAAAVATWSVLDGIAGATSDRVIAENRRAGSTGYRLQSPVADDRILSGWARRDSVRAGDDLEICVLVQRAVAVRAEVYRLGWYGGRGGRLVRRLDEVDVAGARVGATRADTGETDLRLPVAFRVRVPDDWLSGLYVVRLVDGAGRDAHVPFTVRDGRSADIVFSQPVLTYAAYAATPGPTGKSLYDFNSAGPDTTRGTRRATEVSLDRPHRNHGSGDLFVFDHHIVGWMEARGLDVTYVTNVDIDRWPGTLRRGRVAVVSGHDEYWTQRIMDAYLAARDAGVHIVNLGANNAYWRVRLAASRDGRPKRRVICFKYAGGETERPTTVLFRDTTTPMQSLWGVEFMDFFSDTENGPYAPVVPTAADHWFWAGTGARDDQPLAGSRIMGFEVDRREFGRDLPAHTEYTLLASSPFTGEAGRNWCHTTLYRAPGGAYVFSAGTTGWGWGLGRPGFTLPGVDRATANLFARLLDRPALAGNGRTIAAATALDEILAADDYRAEDAVVLRLYHAVFDRTPDLGGAKFWLAARRDGWSPRRVAAHFAASEEFARTYGRLDDRAFVDLVYRNVLDRAPDPGGFAYWTGRLASGRLAGGGLGRGELILLVADSPEFTARHPYAPR